MFKLFAVVFAALLALAVAEPKAEAKPTGLYYTSPVVSAYSAYSALPVVPHAVPAAVPAAIPYPYNAPLYARSVYPGVYPSHYYL